MPEREPIPARIDGDQPLACQVLITEDGNGWDAATCSTCGTVLGLYPQPRHSLSECVRSLRDQLVGGDHA